MISFNQLRAIGALAPYDIREVQVSAEQAADLPYPPHYVVVDKHGQPASGVLTYSSAAFEAARLNES